MISSRFLSSIVVSKLLSTIISLAVQKYIFVLQCHISHYSCDFREANSYLSSFLFCSVLCVAEHDGMDWASKKRTQSQLCSGCLFQRGPACQWTKSPKGKQVASVEGFYVVLLLLLSHAASLALISCIYKVIGCHCCWIMVVYLQKS